MATNFIQPGDVIECIAPATVTSGTPVQIGRMLVVPMVSASSGARFNGMLRGVFQVTKVGSQAWTEGAIVYWDSGNTRFTTVGNGNLRAGYAVLGLASAMPGSGSGETTGYVMLTGSTEEPGT